mgnify:CR=1 FL=1
MRSPMSVRRSAFLLSFLALASVWLPAARAEAEAALSEGDAARVEALAETIRCVVCKNQSIAESDAGLAKDLFRLLEERVAAGDSDEEVQSYLVDRYGEFILLKPKFSLQNMALWLLPSVILLLAILGGVLFIRSKGVAAAPVPLTEEEQAELAQRLGRPPSA